MNVCGYFYPDTFSLCIDLCLYYRTPVWNYLTLGDMPQINPDSAAALQPAMEGVSIGSVPTFGDIDDVDSVYRLVSDLREKARTTKQSA
jgi:hypothetical protein